MSRLVRPCGPVIKIERKEGYGTGLGLEIPEFHSHLCHILPPCVTWRKSLNPSVPHFLNRRTGTVQLLLSILSIQFVSSSGQGLRVCTLPTCVYTGIQISAGAARHNIPQIINNKVLAIPNTDPQLLTGFRCRLGCYSSLQTVYVGEGGDSL